MRRSALLILIAVLAVAVAVPASIAGATAPDAQTAAKAKKKAGKKKAAKCKTAKKKAKGKAKARKSLAAADSAAKKGKAKGKKKAKRKCGKAKAKPTPKTSPRSRSRNPYAERLAERYREKREEMEERRRNAPKAPTLQDVAPTDGTYTAAAAPGLTVTVSGNSTQARVTYTLPMTAFNGAECQTKDVAVDVSGALSLSQTGKAYLMADVSEPNGNRRSATGYLGKDGSFQLGVSAMYEEPPGAGSFCSGSTQLTGTLVN